MWSDVRCFGKKTICDLLRMLCLVRNVTMWLFIILQKRLLSLSISLLMLSCPHAFFNLRFLMCSVISDVVINVSNGFWSFFIVFFKSSGFHFVFVWGWLRSGSSFSRLCCTGVVCLIWGFQIF